MYEMLLSFFFFFIPYVQYWKFKDLENPAHIPPQHDSKRHSCYPSLNTLLKILWKLSSIIVALLHDRRPQQLLGHQQELLHNYPEICSPNGSKTALQCRCKVKTNKKKKKTQKDNRT